MCKWSEEVGGGGEEEGGEGGVRGVKFLRTAVSLLSVVILRE